MTKDEALRLAREALNDVDALRSRIVAMMRMRGWSLAWPERSSYLHLEAAELTESVRGKRGDTLGESADVLITLLALSPHPLPEIIIAATAKVADLETRSPYRSEERHAALRPAMRQAGEAVRLLRWWADESMKTSSITEAGIVSQMDRRRETEEFLAAIDEAIEEGK